MNVKDISTISKSDITDESIQNLSVVGLKIKDTTNDVGELENMTLTSYISDATLKHTKNTITELKKSASKIELKQTRLNEYIQNIKSINQTDINPDEFEKQIDKPISFKDAIDAVAATYITTTALQEIVNDVYRELWIAVNDMFTTGFQMSMYARQYTGTIQGIDAKNPAFNKIVFED